MVPDQSPIVEVQSISQDDAKNHHVQVQIILLVGAYSVTGSSQRLTGLSQQGIGYTIYPNEDNDRTSKINFHMASKPRYASRG